MIKLVGWFNEMIQLASYERMPEHFIPGLLPKTLNKNSTQYVKSELTRAQDLVLQIFHNKQFAFLAADGFKVFTKADSILIVSMSKDAYASWCLAKSNEWNFYFWKNVHFVCAMIQLLRFHRKLFYCVSHSRSQAFGFGRHVAHFCGCTAHFLHKCWTQWAAENEIIVKLRPFYAWTRLRVLVFFPAVCLHCT